METRRRNTGYSICIRTDTGQRANATSVGTDSGKGCLRQACKHPWHHGVCRSGTHTTGGERKLQEKGEGKENG